VRIYQNNRDVEASANLLPVPIGISASEGLVDMVMDAPRQRLYIANSGLNRVEVFDLRTQRFMQPVRVGQLPRSMAMGNDGATLYVVNSGAESISIVDLEKGLTVGRVKFPPLPFNAAFATVTPSVIAPSRRGPQVVMSDGSLWKIVDDTAVPRTLNPAVFGTARTIAGPVRTMASTPAGEFVLLLAGNGTAYLYSSELDDYVVGRQVIAAPIQGYFGPIAAGPAGRYYLVNGTVLNEALTPMNSADPVAASRRISAVAPMGQNNYVRFSQPVRANINALPTDPGLFEMLEATTNRVMASTGALEGPISVAVGNARVNIDGRTMAVDPSGAFAYALTSTGLSIISLASGPPRTRPSISRDGVVSAASYLPSMAPGSLISIFGQNLAASATASSTPLPILMGGSCVTLNNQPIPLFMTSPGQINAQIPPNVAAGRYPLIVRSIAKSSSIRRTASTASGAFLRSASSKK
jgi:DNA-binding beta-propeller fold protein YncE